MIQGMPRCGGGSSLHLLAIQCDPVSWSTASCASIDGSDEAERRSSSVDPRCKIRNSPTNSPRGLWQLPCDPIQTLYPDRCLGLENGFRTNGSLGSKLSHLELTRPCLAASSPHIHGLGRGVVRLCRCLPRIFGCPFCWEGAAFGRADVLQLSGSYRHRLDRTRPTVQPLVLIYEATHSSGFLRPTINPPVPR